MKDSGLSTHYFPPFYGDFVGPHHEKPQQEGESPSQQEKGPEADDFLLVYRSNQVQRSLVTLTFTADSISFVVNR